MGSGAEPFFCVHVRVEVDETEEAEAGECQEAADRITAECWDAGAAGIEERSLSQGILLLIYAAGSVLKAVVDAATVAGGRIDGEPQPVEDLDWSQSWKQGLEAIEISPRLVVRPSFVECKLREGQCEIVIDPGQAFGTGGHASTHLILQWLDVLSPELGEDTRVLDVGTGTGVLALAALALGAGRAVGFDLDPRAVIEARVWAERNGYANRLSLFTGGIESLLARPFDLVLANLLRRELLPIVPALSECVGERGRVVLSGLLAEEQERVEEAMKPHGFETLGVRFVHDSTGDHWVSLLMARH
ncbi:MAG: 50S ribosomal protein L11 methyltransferase [Deltaproteobacteria bacterium]|nr:50S ribosomal protein L11 methyltransferase [Deltaproteobacteria bacterium]MBW2726173.1 50S ribosomal protein L11 methyltransferase [Deltaproteobacteria bacterium]